MAGWKALQLAENKYTDAEAVAAVAAADDYIKNDAEDVGYVNISVNQPTGQSTYLKGFKATRSPGFILLGNGTSNADDFFGMLIGQPKGNKPGFQMQGRQADVETPSYSCMALQAANKTGSGTIGNNDKAVEIYNWGNCLATWMGDGTFDIKNNIIKNPKNHTHSALSGTKKLVEIDIGGTSYYFEVYPTKA